MTPNQPIAVGRQPAVVLHDDADVLLRAEFGQSAEPVGRQFRLFFRRQLVVGPGVDADRMATQKFGRLDPFVVILDRLGPFGIVRIAKIAFVVAHDEHAGDAEVVAALFQFRQITLIFGLIHEELIHVLDGIDSEILLGGFREIEVVHFLLLQRVVKRPFRQRDFEWRRFIGPKQFCWRGGSQAQPGCRNRRGF
jgi:hypothetical protein